MRRALTILLKLKSREITTVCSAKFQKDVTTKMHANGERDFVKFELDVSFGGLTQGA